jgi:transposase
VKEIAMSMGRRPSEEQGEFWVPTAALPRSPGHVFYDKLNRLLGEGGFDRHIEALCRPHYSDEVGRTSIPPGVYFRMLLVGYFEGIDSQRGIAWRCADSLSLRSFLGVPMGESTPEHSSLTRIRERLPLEIHEEVFVFVLKLAHERKLLRGKTVAIDSTTLEANAAMRNILRKDTGEDYKTYLKRLLAEEGVENATDEEARRFDKTRKKKMSNEEWQSQSDPESKIAKMKDGRTHLAYKAEHAVDLDSGLLLSVEVLPATAPDPSTVVDRAMDAELKLQAAGSAQTVDEVVADKGYHKAQTLSTFEDLDTRTYIPEPEGRQYKSADHPEDHRRAAKANRRRMRGDRGKRLQKRRSELAERSFAHVCETGGARRTWLRGKAKINKRYLVQAAGYNLNLLMRTLFGVGKPRVLQGTDRSDGSADCCATKLGAVGRWIASITVRIGRGMKSWWAAPLAALARRSAANRRFSTGC